MKKSFVRWHDKKTQRKPQPWRQRRRKFVPRARNKELLRAGEQKLTICSWNVDEKHKPEEVDKMLTESLKEQPDVVCLQKANFPAPDTETDNYKWLCSGTSGSAILIKKTSDLVSNNFEKCCDQICMTEVVGKEGIKNVVISCYIPPVSHYTNEELWNKLKEIIASISSVTFILAGDFNAELGKDDVKFTPQSEFYQKRLFHKSSDENGIKLRDLMMKCHLKLFLSEKSENSGLFNFKDDNTKREQSYIFGPYLRQSFSVNGYLVWHSESNHAFIYHELVFKPPESLNFETEQESSKDKPLPVIASWNIQNATPTKVDSLLNENSLPIVCIQELFLTSDEDIQTDNYTWLSSKKLWAKNVGILVKKSPNIVVSNFEPLSEYLCTANILFHERPVTVVSFYLPAASEPEHDQLLSQTKEKIKGIQEEAFVFLGGDFSSSIKPEGELPNADEYVKNFAKETNMGLVDEKDSRKQLKVVTQITDTGKYKSHYVLLSQTALKTLHFRFNCRWIPFFENTIICVSATLNDAIRRYLNFDRLRHMEKPLTEVKEDTVDGVKIKTSTSTYTLQEDKISLVSADDKERFKTTPPSAEDLSRMLNDFVLVQGPTPKSNIVASPFGVLCKSFIDCKLGKFCVENITETKSDNTGRTICRIKWNDILLAEEIGQLNDRQQILLKKAAQFVIAKLSQTFYSIKAKRNFFNISFEPDLLKIPELADKLKLVEKSSFSTMPEVYKHIDDFINEDTDAELLFRNEFTRREQFEIADYAQSKKELMEFRFIKPRSITAGPDQLAIYRKYSPQCIRDALIKEPKNYKYFLIPPCGLGVNHLEFNKEILKKISKEENDTWNRFRNKTKQSSDDKKPVVVNGGDSNLKRSVKPTKKNPPARRNVRPQPLDRVRSAGRNPRIRQSERSQPLGRDRLNERSSRYQNMARSPPLERRKRDFGMMRSNENGSYNEDISYETSLIRKRQRMERSDDNISFKFQMPEWDWIRPLVIVWPITVNSRLEDRPEIVLSENFTVQFKTKTVNGQPVTAVFVLFTHVDGFEKVYCIARENTTRKAARLALDLLVKHCTIIKPNAAYLFNGRTPNFIRYRVPCQLVPRTYLILDRAETGPLSARKIEDLVDRFLNSCEEDMYFDRNSYTFEEKLALLETVPKLAPQRLFVRHFGDDFDLVDRYVCVYKPKPHQQILNEVLKLGGSHHKYAITTNRLPPGMDYNRF